MKQPWYLVGGLDAGTMLQGSHSQVSGVISLKFSGDLENYTFLETSGCTESENP